VSRGTDYKATKYAQGSLFGFLSLRARAEKACKGISQAERV